MLLALIAILAIFTIIGALWENSRKKTTVVEANSEKIRLIRELNASTKFDLIFDRHSTKVCKSKPEYDRTDLWMVFLQYVDENKTDLRNMLEGARNNYYELSAYEDEYSRIMDLSTNTDFRKVYPYFESVEKRICNREKLTATASFVIDVQKTYSSPGGNNSYSDRRVYSMGDLEKAFNEIDQKRITKQIYQNERASMTESLRYDILKRDGFRCVICGASAVDGVKLHVDHIRPVSKGGKTVASNLRTLCQRCNLGKSDKYDEDGLN